jgi:hypothetical protein
MKRDPEPWWLRCLQESNNNNNNNHQPHRCRQKIYRWKRATQIPQATQQWNKKKMEVIMDASNEVKNWRNHFFMQLKDNRMIPISLLVVCLFRMINVKGQVVGWGIKSCETLV